MLPTLRECSFGTWTAGALPSQSLTANGSFDAWKNPHPWQGVDAISGDLSGYLGPRVAEDVVLNNVIGFDVKVWDPGRRSFRIPGKSCCLGTRGISRRYQRGRGEQRVDRQLWGVRGLKLYGEARPDGERSECGSELHADGGAPAPLFHWAGDLRSMTRGTEPATNPVGSATLRPAVYDTWSTHYESDGLKQNRDSTLPADAATNGFDDNSDGVVDDAGEMDAPPPYSAPLRGIQIKIRCFEPTSRQVREVTVVQEFVTK